VALAIIIEHFADMCGGALGFQKFTRFIAEKFLVVREIKIHRAVPVLLFIFFIRHWRAY